MRVSPVVLLLFVVLGCGSGTQPSNPSAESGGDQAKQRKVGAAENQDVTPAAKAPAEEPVAEKPVAEKPVAAKAPAEEPVAETPGTAKTPDVATVKKAMTPAQLALGDPIANSIGMVLVPIPAGQFQMGSQDSDRDAAGNEKPQHRVKITKPFYLSVYEVTQEQYKKVMGVRPWQGKTYMKDGPDYPATYVSHDAAVEFCRKLSEQEGVEYRLPTEAQWEYACRAGTTTIYSFGDDASKLGQYAWYDKNAWGIGEKYAHRVGQKQPNPWGLYDMHGNVWEWCEDGEGNYEGSAVEDPTGPASESDRVLRGGSSNYGTDYCRSAFRSGQGPAYRNYALGFRVSRTCKAETSAAKPPAAEAATKKTPDVATVKKAMTPAQLVLGDPVVNSIGMVLVPIPAGQFQMGSPDAAQMVPSSEKPQHLVKITKPFYLSVFEVTQEQYEQVMEARPWQGKIYVQDGPDYAATNVNWDDAVAFCRKLSEQEGMEYRLPTEAQWEYTCRAGTTTAYSYGDDGSKLGQHAWYKKNASDNGEKYAHRVGQKQPNPWGLYDMHSNVSEWCRDWYGKYENVEVVDPWGPATGESRVLRGGSFGDVAVYCRSAFRNNWQPVNRSVYSGFRVSRTYP